MPLAPGALVGPYRLDRFLGQGGVAAVYTASHTVLGGVFAVKVYPTGGMPELADRTRFQREIATIARLRHPNVLAIVDYGHDDAGTYLVGDWMDGGSLAARIGTPMPASDVVRILGPIAAALDYAHGEGVVHRDVKAANVLFTLDGRPMLSDFAMTSLASALVATTMPTGGLQAMAGMPPEQALGEAVVPQTDQYALAILAYQMLAGRIPFRLSAPLAVPPPREANPNIGDELEQALLRGLARRPDDRFASAGDLMAAIERASAAERAAPDGAAGAPVPIPGPVELASEAADTAAGVATGPSMPPVSPIPAAEPSASSTRQFVRPSLAAGDAEATVPPEPLTIEGPIPTSQESTPPAGPVAAQEDQRTQPVELPRTPASASPLPAASEPLEPLTVLQQLPSPEGRPRALDAAERTAPPTIVEPSQRSSVSEEPPPRVSTDPSAATVFTPIPSAAETGTPPTVFEPAAATPPTVFEPASITPPPPSPPPIVGPTSRAPVAASSPSVAVPGAPTVFGPAPAGAYRDGGGQPQRAPAFPWIAAGVVVVAAIAVVLVLAWLLRGRGPGGLAAVGTVASGVPSPAATFATVPTAAPVAAAVPPAATAVPSSAVTVASSAATATPASTATNLPSPAPTATAIPAAAPATAAPTPRATTSPTLMPTRLVATMGSGQSFCGAVADDDGGQVFVSDSDRGQLVAFDPTTRQQSKVYDLKEWLCGVALDQQRGAVWAPVYHRQASGAFDTSRLASVDLASGAVRYVAGSHFPLTPFLDARAGTLYAGNSADPSLLVVNVQSGQGTDAVPVAAQVNRLASSSVNGDLYMAAVETNMFTVFDPAARKVVAELKVGQQPWGVAAEPSTGMILVSAEGSGHVSLVDPRTNTVVRAYATGSHPHDVACGGTDRHCFVLNSADRTITTVDTASDRTVTSAMLPGEDPLTAMAVAPKTGRVFVVSKRQVFVLDEAT